MKWLLLIILFFNAFTFSVYTGSSQLQQKAQTELVLLKSFAAPRHSVFYNKALKHIYSGISVIGNKEIRKDLTALHNALFKVKLADMLKRVYCIEPLGHHTQLKTIPADSDEEIFV